MFLYKITNTVNGKCYVGVTKNSLKERLAKHIYCANKRQSRFILHRAIRKYGSDKFQIESLATAELWPALLQLERDTIARLGTTQKAIGYNMTAGGEGVLGLTEESRKKISTALKGRPARPHTPEWNEKIATANRGKILSQETRERIAASRRGSRGVHCSLASRAKISASLRGKERTPEHAANISRSLKGKPLSEEHRAKLSASHRGKTLTPEHRANVSRTLKGRIFSPEHRANISRNKTQYYAERREVI